MARRIDVEITSTREDGTWTWRAAGAREPKGTLEGELVPEGVTVGDVLQADAEYLVDGIEILALRAPKGVHEPSFETLEILGTGRDEPLVTSQLRGKGGGRGKKDSRDRGGKGRDRPRGGRGDGRDSRRGPASGGGDDGRGGRPAGRPADTKPKRKRLRAGRVHRSAVLAALPDEQRPLAELVLRGGVPAVRQTVETQHEQAGGSGDPKIRADPLVALAEELMPGLRAAEWHDKADAAVAQIDDVDLRDLRSIVTAAEASARGDEARQLADQLRSGLTLRVDREHTDWLGELAETLSDKRVVRALKLSSRPPKAGSPLPPEIATQLAEQATAALTGDISQDRFAIVLEAVAFSPVHTRVAATSIPTEPKKDLLRAVKKTASRVPAVAAQFGIESSKGQRPPKTTPAATPAVAPTD